jgi:hypothetical protein
MVDKTAVVHTLGTLLEDQRYKAAVRKGGVVGLARAFAGTFGARNPLEEGGEGSYEVMNRDSGED